MSDPKSNIAETAKPRLIEALKKTLGNVKQACEMVGIDRGSFYNYKKEDEDFAKAVEDLKEETIDFVESKLFELINGVTVAKETEQGVKVYDLPPCKTSIIFFLKTRAKHRGYIERQEISNEIKAGKDIKIEIIDADQSKQSIQKES